MARVRPGVLSLGTAVGLLALTVAATLGTRHVVQDQEKKLLRERGAEIGQILSTDFSSLTTSLAGLGAARTPEAFAAAAQPLVSVDKGLRSVSVLTSAGDGFTVTVTAGAQHQVGDVISGARATALTRALHTDKLVTTPVLNEGGQRSLGFALGPPYSAPGTVIYEERAIATTSQPPASSDAFSEIAVTVFTSTAHPADQLILSTAAHEAIPAGSTYFHLKVGDTTWSVGLQPRHPLVGALVAKVHWLVLIAGVLGSFLIATIVEVLLRRRDYALALVAERTGELEASVRQLESAQQQLVRSERLAAVGQLAAAVGHELRNPLGVISNALYLVRAAVKPETDDRLNRHLTTAEREVGAATLIVSDLLEYAKGRAPIVDAVDLPDLIDEALEVAALPPAISVHWDHPQGLPAASGDRDQLRQVLLNLITNASDAMGGAGDLTIRCTHEADRMRVSVTDGGAGMDESTRARIFEPFFTTKARGVGLGLAVSERIATAHEGSLTVADTSPAGTTFVLEVGVRHERPS